MLRVSLSFKLMRGCSRCEVRSSGSSKSNKGNAGGSAAPDFRYFAGKWGGIAWTSLLAHERGDPGTRFDFWSGLLGFDGNKICVSPSHASPIEATEPITERSTHIRCS